MNILLKQIFAGIFVSIACWNRPYDFLECSDNLPNSTAFHSHSVQCYWWYKLFVHWWMKGIYFASFYFRVWDLTREIRENKNPAKISTYTVFQQYSINIQSLWCSIYYSHHPLIAVDQKPCQVQNCIVFATRKKGGNCPEVITKSRC